MQHTNLIHQIQCILYSIFLPTQHIKTHTFSLYPIIIFSPTLLKCFSFTDWTWRECCCTAVSNDKAHSQSRVIQVQSSPTDFPINMKIPAFPRYLGLTPLHSFLWLRAKLWLSDIALPKGHCEAYTKCKAAKLILPLEHLHPLLRWFWLCRRWIHLCELLY